MSIIGSEVDQRWTVTVRVPRSIPAAQKTETRTIAGSSASAEAFAQDLHEELAAGELPRVDRRRFPFEDLKRLPDGHRTIEVARRLDIRWDRVYRFRERGLSEAQADAMAQRAGFLPIEVWADWYRCEGGAS
jgi:hypothetical protein